MKISVVARHHNKQTREVEAEAKKAGVDFELVNISNLTRIGERIGGLGEVVIWRTTSLDIGAGRASFLSRLVRKKVVINAALAEKPFVAHKFYQQKMVEPLRTILSIPTYCFKSKKRLLAAVDNGILSFPLVMKANLGARGEKVFLVRSQEELLARREDVRDFVFQNLIKNKGDYRVLVLGGVALGVMKRVAREGEFRNNVSLGGTFFDASDSPGAFELSEKAITLASLFGLHFCGVDFIKNEETGEFHFLEVNTVPQWQGFREATGINVAAELVAFAKAMGERGNKPALDLVGEYLDQFEKYLPMEKRLHYFSRLFSWTKNEVYRQRLEALRRLALGGDDQGKRQRILQLIEEAEEDQRRMAVKEETKRRSAYLRYPLLSRANNLLFYWLMAKTLFGTDVAKYIEEVISRDELTVLHEKLIKDEAAVRYLSTTAVNFFYLTAEYLSLERPKVDWLLSVLGSEGEGEEKADLKTAVYLLTHIVIGESLFYIREISGEAMGEVVKEAENIIGGNYFDLSLDTKLEFLVCCRLVSYRSPLSKIIFSEAERSLSPLGNFLVDTHNDWKNRHSHKLAQAEHRNTLYLMACSTIKA